MGAGQGKSRRVKSSANLTVAASAQVRYYDKKWEEFVAQSGALGLDALTYYLGDTPPQLVYAEQEKFITELFAQSVAVGARVLPSPYTPDSFRFEVDAKKNDYGF